MKFIFISYISLGLILSLVFGIEYKCNGSEMFPDYYGSPFIFKQKSLGSSMTYYYSVLGLVINVLLWSLLLFFVNKAIENLKTRLKNVLFFGIGYKVVVGILLFISTVNIAFAIITIGNGFDKKLNYWYWNVEKKSSKMGEMCKGEFMLF
jgi:hypothetical protein